MDYENEEKKEFVGRSIVNLENYNLDVLEWFDLTNENNVVGEVLINLSSLNINKDERKKFYLEDTDKNFNLKENIKEKHEISDIRAEIFKISNKKSYNFNKNTLLSKAFDVEEKEGLEVRKDFTVL